MNTVRRVGCAHQDQRTSCTRSHALRGNVAPDAPRPISRAIPRRGASKAWVPTQSVGTRRNLAISATSRRNSQFQSRRSGAILAAVLVCLVVVILIGSSLVTTVLLQHRQQEQEQSALQAFWLAESAVQRAADRLAATRDYAGETWQVDGAELHCLSAGVAVIRVEEAAAGDETSRKIIVEAQYPQDPLHRVVQCREIMVNLTGGAGTRNPNLSP